MNVVDTSGWLEYFTGGANADFFAPAIEDTDHLIVPIICVYEVFKKVFQTHGQAVAEFRVADLMKGNLADFTAPLAMRAAVISAELRLPMADSFIMAVTRENDATLWTQDEHFKDLPGVRYIEK